MKPHLFHSVIYKDLQTNKLLRKKRVTGGQRLTVTDCPVFTSVSVFEVDCWTVGLLESL